MRSRHIVPSLLFCGLAVAAAVLLFGAASPARAQDDPTALAARIQARYDTIRDFQASFEQSYAGGALRRKTTERGTMQVKKPGRMRWEYTQPERKLFIADGRKTYNAYVPADKQVMVADIPTDDRASTPILFLAGKGSLVRDFTVTSATVNGAPANSVALTLTPRRAETEYTAITLVVDKATLEIRMFVAADAQGGTSTFTFTNLRENVNPPDKSFTFTIPKGVDVVSQD